MQCCVCCGHALLSELRHWCCCSLFLESSHSHTHTRLTALCPGLPRWAGTRKVKPIWILLEQETVSGSDISWAICKSAPRSRQITAPALHYSSFVQAGCPSCRPTNSVKALKAQSTEGTVESAIQNVEYYICTVKYLQCFVAVVCLCCMMHSACQKILLQLTRLFWGDIWQILLKLW